MKSLSSRKTGLKTAIIDIVLNLFVFVAGMTAFVCGVIKNGLNAFTFYTENSNLFAAFACLVCVVSMIKNRGKIKGFAYVLKYSATVCLTITFLVVFIVLAPMGGGLEGYKTMFFCDSMILTHLLCPIVCTYSFVKFERTKKPLGCAVFAVLPTVLYGVIMIALNFAKVIEGPYPFFFVYLNPVLAAVCCPLILAVCFLVALAFNSIKSLCNYSYDNVQK